MSDRTELIRAEQAKFFLGSIVESSQDSIITVDFNGIVTSWNKAAEHLYGYAANEAIGRSLTALTLPENLGEVLRKTERVKHGKKVEVFDSIRLNGAGREMILEVVLSPVKNDAE